jgi:hypothetical protein
MLNNGQNDEGSDTTDDDSSADAGNIILRQAQDDNSYLQPIPLHRNT